MVHADVGFVLGCACRSLAFRFIACLKAGKIRSNSAAKAYNLAFSSSCKGVMQLGSCGPWPCSLKVVVINVCIFLCRHLNLANVYELKCERQNPAFQHIPELIETW